MTFVFKNLYRILFKKEKKKGKLVWYNDRDIITGFVMRLDENKTDESMMLDQKN